jgi:hypothetical protein
MMITNDPQFRVGNFKAQCGTEILEDRIIRSKQSPRRWAILGCVLKNGRVVYQLPVLANVTVLVVKYLSELFCLFIRLPSR